MDANAYSNMPEATGKERRGPIISGRLIVGLAILAMGVLFLLDNLDVLDASELYPYWPAIVILLGLAKFANGTSMHERLGSLVWMVVGTWLLLGSLDIISVSIWQLWPIGLILVGISLVGRSFMRGSSSSKSEAWSRVNAFAIMGGADRRVTTPDFHGGDVVAIMGGCDIDLRQADIKNGPAVIDIVTIWGGVDLKIPTGWSVKNEGLALLGAFEDSRKDVSGDPNKVLIVRGVAIMGGVEIKA